MIRADGAVALVEELVRTDPKTKATEIKSERSVMFIGWSLLGSHE